MAEETITTRAGPIVPAPRAIPEARERPTAVRALSTFSVAEQRAILALVLRQRIGSPIARPPIIERPRGVGDDD
jgi:hypothetical protein